jgi:hypothetical protein
LNGLWTTQEILSKGTKEQQPKAETNKKPYAKPEGPRSTNAEKESHCEDLDQQTD